MPWRRILCLVKHRDVKVYGGVDV